MLKICSKETPFFFEKMLFIDKSDFSPNKCGKLYIRKAKEEELELDYGHTSNIVSRTMKFWVLLVHIEWPSQSPDSISLSIFGHIYQMNSERLMTN